MKKTVSFSNGAPVKAKKINKEKFLGVYLYSYNDGSHCIFDGTKKWCCPSNSVWEADESETAIIQETIIKPQKRAEKKKEAEAKKVVKKVVKKATVTVETE